MRHSRESLGEAEMAAALRARGVPFEREHRFAMDSGRRWRFDFFIPAMDLAIEVQGGVFTRGAHVRGRALCKEYEKLNEAARRGIRVLFAVRNGHEADISLIADQVSAEFERLEWRDDTDSRHMIQYPGRAAERLTPSQPSCRPSGSTRRKPCRT